MNENNQPLVVRSKLLPNNSAAEFVETRTGRLLGPEFSRPNGAEFAPVVDMFVNQDIVSSLSFDKYSRASREKCKEFEALLTGTHFTKLVVDRQVEKRFHVKPKCPQKYEVHDVLEMAEKIHMKHGSASKVREYTEVFRKCFAAVGRNQGAVKNFLSFIPSDSYGSVIFGGFTLILTAIERDETIRETEYAALAEIPRKLEFINNLTDCVRESIGLYQAEDAVLVALFSALTGIIHELTRSKGRRTLSLLIKGRSYGSDIDSALELLETKLSAFKDEVMICNSRRLGEMEQSQVRIEESQSRIEICLQNRLKQVSAEKASIEASKSNPAKSIEENYTNDQEHWSLEEKDRCIEVLNKLYRLCTSDPKFDAYTGGYIHHDAEKILKATRVRSQKFANEWLSALPLQFQDLAHEDMNNLLKRSTLLSMDDQDKVQHIMADPGLFEWLNALNSTVLLVQSELTFDESINPLSFSSAFLAQTLQATYKSPVLYYNCRIRREESLDEEMSGPLALLNTLNAQLIIHILETQADSVELDFLKKDELSKNSRKRIKYKLRESRRLFKRLIECLPESDVVFIIIDGMSCLTGDENLANKVLRDILRLASHSTTRRVKLLLTDVLSKTVLDYHDYLEVFVDSRVDSSGQPLNLQFLQEETQNTLSTNS